jgi:uncharacterized RDD family membrane protein YckC
MSSAEFATAPAQVPAQVPAPMPATGDWVPMADWGVRVAARILDELLGLLGGIPYVIGLLLLVANSRSGVVAGGAGGGATVGQAPADPGQLIVGLVLMLLGAGISLAIFIWNRVIRQGRTGQSVGKAALNLYLVSANDGNPIGAGTSFVREVVHLVDGIFYLGYLWPLWDPRKQTFADKILNTLVAHPQAHPSTPEPDPA